MHDPSPAAVAALENAENDFYEALEPLERFLMDGVTGSSSAAEFAIDHLVARSIADLKCGILLATKGYVVQTYSVIRPVVESINLVELFAQDPDRAREWSEGEHRQFSPAKVREALGQGDDEIYSFMCSMSHPRWAGTRASTYRRSDGQGVMLTGGLPLDHPFVFLAGTKPFYLLCGVALAAQYCPVRPEVALRWAAMLREVVERAVVGPTLGLCSLDGRL
jgi:hypothetical protein